MKITRKELNSLIESFLLKEEIAGRPKPTFKEVRAALRRGGYGMDELSSTMRITINKGPHAGKSGLMIALFDGPDEKELLDFCKGKARVNKYLPRVRQYFPQSVQEQAYEYLKGKFGEGKVALVDVANVTHDSGKSGGVEQNIRRIKTDKSGVEQPVEAGLDDTVYNLQFIKKNAGDREENGACLDRSIFNFLMDNFPKKLEQAKKKFGSCKLAKFFTVVIPSVDK